MVAIGDGDMALHILVGVAAGDEDVDAQIGGGHGGQEAVEFVEAAAVEILAEPAVAGPAGDVVDHRDEKAAQKTAGAYYAQVKRDAEASHGVRNLVVEVLL